VFDVNTYECLLQGLASMKSLDSKVIHAHVIKMELGLIYLWVTSSQHVCQCWNMMDASKVFDELVECDLVLSNAYDCRIC
jgi:hypothetical protein